MNPPPRHRADAAAAWEPPRSKTVTWYDPTVIPSGGAGLSGLEFIEALAASRLPPPPIAFSSICDPET
jgi:hypothetical protein